MTTQEYLIIRRRGRTEGWEHEEKGSYEVEDLREQYRQRLYTQKGLEVLRAKQAAEEQTTNQE